MDIYKELALLGVLQLVVGCIPHISSRCVFLILIGLGGPFLRRAWSNEMREVELLITREHDRS